MSTPTIAQQVADMRSNQAKQPPNEISEIFERDQTMLAAVLKPNALLSVGSTVPDVELIGSNGVPTSLGAAMGGRPCVVVFYRGAWCPYCNITLGNYQAHLLPALSDRGVQLIAVSPQRPDGSLTMQQKHDLTFPVLSDPGSVLAQVMGIVTAPSSDVRARRCSWAWTSRHSTQTARLRFLFQRPPSSTTVGFCGGWMSIPTTPLGPRRATSSQRSTR